MASKNRNLITVIIATYNRCESLSGTLDSILTQEHNGSFSYEVIVADNNSKDSTKQVVQSFKEKFNSRLKYLFEPKQGKSYALNRGIKEAKGEIIAFTDDDCILDKNWLSQIDSMFKQHKIGIVGGVINPIWLGKRPNWLNRKFYGKLGIQNYGERSFITSSDKKLPFGANFAFRKDLFYKYGSFNEKMKLALDTEICMRFLRKGVKIGYNPQIVVYHKINPLHLRKKHFYNWFYYRGLLHKHIQDYKIKPYHLFDIPLWFVLCFIKDIARSLNPFMSKPHRAYYRCHSFWWLGMISARFKDNFKLRKND